MEDLGEVWGPIFPRGPGTLIFRQDKRKPMLVGSTNGDAGESQMTLDGHEHEPKQCQQRVFVGDYHKSLSFFIGDNNWVVYNWGLFLMVFITC